MKHASSRENTFNPMCGLSTYVIICEKHSTYTIPSIEYDSNRLPVKYLPYAEQYIRLNVYDYSVASGKSSASFRHSSLSQSHPFRMAHLSILKFPSCVAASQVSSFISHPFLTSQMGMSKQTYSATLAQTSEFHG